MFEKTDYSEEIESMREAAIRAKTRVAMFCELERMRQEGGQV